MDFEDLYFALENAFGKESVSIPILPEFNLDNIVEGSFLLRMESKPAQEIAKGMIRQYILGEKAKGKDVMLIVLTSDSETGGYGSPVAFRAEGIYYDGFPESIDLAVIYCMERCVFDSLYRQALTRLPDTKAAKC